MDPVSQWEGVKDLAAILKAPRTPSLQGPAAGSPSHSAGPRLGDESTQRGFSDAQGHPSVCWAVATGMAHKAAWGSRPPPFQQVGSRFSQSWGAPSLSLVGGGGGASLPAQRHPGQAA